jgi:hypothetical protein
MLFSTLNNYIKIYLNINLNKLSNMENTKYSNICNNYELILKEECIGKKMKEPYCEMVSTLLSNCYKFKEMKLKKELKESLKLDKSLK